MPRVANRPAFMSDHVLDGLNQVPVENIVDVSAQSPLARYAEDFFKSAVPGRDPAIKINYQNTYVNAFDDILGELLEPRELFRFLHLRPVQQTVINSDRDVA